MSASPEHDYSEPIFTSTKGYPVRRSKSHISYKLNIPPPLPLPRTQKRNVSPQFVLDSLREGLPLNFIVSSGNYGAEAYSTFSEDEELSAHFVHQLEYVLLETQSRVLYKVPLGSSFNFGLIYNPHRNLPDAMKGYLFTSPSMLLDAPVHPKLVAVVQGHVDKDPQYAVEPEDILFVVGEVRLGKKKFLKCTQVSSGLPKFIREDWNVQFSTRPNRVFLPLSSMMQYMSSSCPFLAIIEHPSKSKSSILPKELANNSIICLTKKADETTVICSREMFSEKVLFALPANFDIDLKQVVIPKSDHENLCITSAEYFKSFNYNEVKLGLLAECSSASLKNNSNTQLLFYEEISNEEVITCSRIICPIALQKYLPLQKLSTKKISDSLNNGKTSSNIVSRLEIVEDAMQTVLAELQLLKEKLKLQAGTKKQDGSENSNDQLAETAFDMVVEMNKKFVDLRDWQAKVESQFAKVHETVGSIEGNMLHSSFGDYQPLVPPRTYPKTPSMPSDVITSNDTGIGSSSGGEDEKAIQEANLKYFETLNNKHIIQILQHLGMTEYIATFQAEKITGELLTQLDESDLVKELNIFSRIHRIRLLQFIKGKQSAFTLLSKDPSIHS